VSARSPVAVRAVSPAVPAVGHGALRWAPRKMKPRGALSPHPCPSPGARPWGCTSGVSQRAPSGGRDGFLLSRQARGCPARFGLCRRWPGSPARQTHRFQSEALRLRPQETLLRAGGGGEVAEQDVPPQPEQHRAVAAGDHRQPPVRGGRGDWGGHGAPQGSPAGAQMHVPPRCLGIRVWGAAVSLCPATLGLLGCRVLSSAGRISPTGSPLSTSSSPCWSLAPTASPPSASPST